MQAVQVLLLLCFSALPGGFPNNLIIVLPVLDATHPFQDWLLAVTKPTSPFPLAGPSCSCPPHSLLPVATDKLPPAQLFPAPTWTYLSLWLLH